MYREADGCDDRRAVREQLRRGADFVKVMTTGARSVELEDPDPAHSPSRIEGFACQARCSFLALAFKDRGFRLPGEMLELRKMTDTRSGFWLLLVTALLTVAVTVIACFVLADEDATLLNFFAIATVPASLLLPVVGILLVISEWTQRTAMIAFALVPHRPRVLVAKLLAGLVLAAIALQVCLVTGLAATAFAGADGDKTWSLSAALIGQGAVSITLPMVSGIAFGAVLLFSAPAIVLYYVLPTAWSALGAIPKLEGAARWLDTSRTTTPLLEETLSSTQWARLATSVALWTLLPLALGFWRVLRSDVR